MDEEKLSEHLLVKLCSDKAAFEAKPKRRVIFNMEHLKQLLEAETGHEILVYTPHIMVIRRYGGAEVTFSRDGRMLIRKVPDITEVEKVAKDMLRIVLKATTSAPK